MHCNLVSAAAPKVESKIETATLGPQGYALSPDLPGKVNLGCGDLNRLGVLTE